MTDTENAETRTGARFFLPAESCRLVKGSGTETGHITSEQRAEPLQGSRPRRVRPIKRD